MQTFFPPGNQVGFFGKIWWRWVTKVMAVELDVAAITKSLGGRITSPGGFCK